MVIAVTSIVTVTVPPEAIVAEPANAPLALKVKVLVVALLLTALLMRLSVLVNWLGKVSLIVPVKVDGPAFVTTSVKLVVLPAATVEEPTSLVTPRLTTAVTVPATVAEVLPLLVVPAGTNTVTVLV